MTENIVVGLFYIEEESFRAMEALKENPVEEKSIISQAVLAKKEDGTVKVLDSFDTGAITVDDTVIGSLAGACVGIIGGPIGVLLGSSYGAMVGSAMDAADAADQASMIEVVANKLQDNECVIIALAAEDDESIIDEKLRNYHDTILRFDAGFVAQEVEEARMMEAEMARQAYEEFRKEKNEEYKSKVDDHKAKIKAKFEEFKNSLK